MRFRSMLVSLLVIASLITACSGPATPTSTSLQVVPVSSATAVVPRSDRVPKFKHVVIVIEENKSYQDIIGSPYTPYINSLAAQGASFTNAHGEWHPSQPNYLALFAGLTPEELTVLTQGVVTGDQCIQPRSIQRPNLASELGAQQFSFTGYAEDVPSDLSKCYTPGQDKDPNGDAPWVVNADKDTYVSKHIPWLNFADVPASVTLPLTEFPKDYTKLPTISFVIPNDQNNMHPAEANGPTEKDMMKWSKSLRAADDWLKKNLDGYIQWAKTHNSLFILTWDEDSSPQVCSDKKDIDLATRSDLCKSMYPSGVIRYPDKNGTPPMYNRIPTIFVGSGVKAKAGGYGECITHYDILRTLEDMYGLPLMGETNPNKPSNPNPNELSGTIQEACGRSASEPITNVWGG